MFLACTFNLNVLVARWDQGGSWSMKEHSSGEIQGKLFHGSFAYRKYFLEILFLKPLNHLFGFLKSIFLVLSKLRKLNRNVILCVCVLANYCSVSFSGK
jgi:hypothetical protein